VRKLAEHFLNMFIRAIDYCPPVDIRFGEYLRALLTSDYDVVPDDAYGYRDKLIKSFRRRNIPIAHVLDLSQDSLRWGKPDIKVEPITGLRFRDLDSKTTQCATRDTRKFSGVPTCWASSSRAMRTGSGASGSQSRLAHTAQ
jgi:hypothetical protein